MTYNKNNNDCSPCYITCYRRFLHILLWLPPFVFVLLLQLRLMISLSSVPSLSGSNNVLSTYDLITLLLNPIASSNENDNNIIYSITKDANYHTGNTPTFQKVKNDTTIRLVESNDTKDILDSFVGYMNGTQESEQQDFDEGNYTTSSTARFSNSTPIDEGRNVTFSTDYSNSTTEIDAGNSSTFSMDFSNDTEASQKPDNELELHIVFSTGCSPFQDWQSYAFFYHIWRSEQPGYVTRIVSGCNERQQQKMENDFQNNILKSIPSANERFHLHFTPEYSHIHLTHNPNDTKKSYKFFNKPFGLKHWMEQKLGYIHTHEDNDETTNDTRQSMDNTVIIILDPDQLVLKPFVVDYTKDTGMKWHGYNPDWSNETMQLRKGRLFSQLYGMGTSWVPTIVSKVNKTIIGSIEWHTNDSDTQQTNITTGDSTKTNDWIIQNISFYMNRSNHLHKETKDTFYQYYNAGPPYIGIASDMYDIVTVWSDIVIPVYYESEKAHLAEMFAYCAAAAYLGLRHQLTYSLMVSHPEIGQTDETWADENQVEKNDTYFLQWSNPTHFYNNQIEAQTYVPYVFHYCQEYSLGPYHFFKYYIPNEILSCSHPMLLEPPSRLVTTDSQTYVSTNVEPQDCGSIAFQYDTTFSLHKNPRNLTNHIHIRHHAYALCQVIYRVNDAIEFWKDHNCNIDPNETTAVNYNKTWTLKELQQTAVIQ